MGENVSGRGKVKWAELDRQGGMANAQQRVSDAVSATPLAHSTYSCQQPQYYS